MSSAHPKDYLSAFYDREATPEEEATAKSLVNRAPEASREVQDYRRLSRLIQEVPRAVAPPEFAAAVMQRAERESLIPLDPVATPAIATTAPPALGFGGFRLVLGGGRRVGCGVDFQLVHPAACTPRNGCSRAGRLEAARLEDGAERRDVGLEWPQ